MSRLDELPPDQRAALSLLLSQRKSYANLAALLGIPEQAVHARAHAALAVLAPRQARELTPERRQQIGDYLLEQQPIADRLLTRSQLSGSEPDRVWAQAIRSELEPLANRALPEIPPAAAEDSTTDGAKLRSLAAASTPGSSTAGSSTAGSSSAGSSSAGSSTSSRLGGAILLLAIVAAIVVAVVLISRSGDGSHAKSSSSVSSSTPSRAPTTSAQSPGTSTATGAAGAPAVTQRLALHSPNPASRSVGLVEVLQESGKRAFYIAAEHLPASRGFFYAIWLYNSHTSALPLSKSPAVSSSGHLAGGALLPSSAGSYREILLTRETSDHPAHPGSVVLRGTFSLGG